MTTLETTSQNKCHYQIDCRVNVQLGGETVEEVSLLSNDIFTYKGIELTSK